MELKSLNSSNMKSVIGAKRGSIVRLSRTGKGSVSGYRTEHTTKQTKLIDVAYANVRLASNY